MVSWLMDLEMFKTRVGSVVELLYCAKVITEEVCGLSGLRDEI